MDWNTVSRNWSAFHESILQRWPEVEENDLIRIDGDRAVFEGLIAKTGAMSGSEAREEISQWLEGGIPSDVVMDEHHDNASITQSARHIPEGEDVYAEDRDFGDDDKNENPVGRES